MNDLRRLLVFAILSFVADSAYAAGEGADFFQAVGKIYVVVAVIVVTFVGLAYYLYRLDRRIKTLEDNTPHE